ncbi:AMP-binding protein [Rhodococcus sp. BE178]|uniref:AMP-binding protein n=1 Tax=Rhodococcus sp. BE178 TaxID=2817737 RepID=UPI003D19A03A
MIGRNTDAVTAAHGYTLAALFEQSFVRFADRVAVASDDSSLTYAEVGDRSRRLAVGLQETSSGRGSRVAVLSQPRPEYAECYAALPRGHRGEVSVGLVLDEAVTFARMASAGLSR